MLSPEAMDIIVEGISAEICKDNPTPECPVAVDGLLRAGLPVLAAMADDAGFEQVFWPIWEKGNYLKCLILNLHFTRIFCRILHFFVNETNCTYFQNMQFL